MSGTKKRSTNLGNENSETDSECQDIVDLSTLFPMFSEEPGRLRADLKQREINSTSLRYHLFEYYNKVLFLRSFQNRN